MDLLFLGTYRGFVRGAIARMELKPRDRLLDLGCGTGRNMCMMLDAVGGNLDAVGVDISDEMLAQARQRCAARPRVDFLQARIEEPLPFREEFDHACLFFVLHGFEDGVKRRILTNVRGTLRPGGRLWILDYNEFQLDAKPWLARTAFRALECELAAEFLTLDLKGMLAEAGFADFTQQTFLHGYVRLLGARRTETGAADPEDPSRATEATMAESSWKWQMERERLDKDRFFAADPQSPIPRAKRSSFTGLRYYPPDPSYRLVLTLKEHAHKKTIEIGDTTGYTRRLIRWGEFRFVLEDKKCTLQVYKSSGSEGGFFVPFKDKTNGKETYGAGRYLDLDPARHMNPDGTWVLDFNEAYNPWCAYSEDYSCPFVPPENWLKVPVRAGEKAYPHRAA